MPLNWDGVFVAAFIPLIVRLVWDHSGLLGKTWRDAAGVNPDEPEWARTAAVAGLSLVFGFLMASIVMPLVIHQIHVFSIVQGDPAYGKEDARVTLWLEDFLREYGDSHRTFKHGAVHGAIAGLCFATPMIAINALFERRGLKYILITSGYWTICLALMGAIVCGWR